MCKTNMLTDLRRVGTAHAHKPDLKCHDISGTLITNETRLKAWQLKGCFHSCFLLLFLLSGSAQVRFLSGFAAACVAGE